MTGACTNSTPGCDSASCMFAAFHPAPSRKSPSTCMPSAGGGWFLYVAASTPSISKSYATVSMGMPCLRAKFCSPAHKQTEPAAARTGTTRCQHMRSPSGALLSAEKSLVGNIALYSHLRGASRSCGPMQSKHRAGLGHPAQRTDQHAAAVVAGAAAARTCGEEDLHKEEARQPEH